MTTEKTNGTKVRTVKESYGVVGVKLDLSLAHIYNLMVLQQECASAMIHESEQSPAYNLAKQMLGVLNFIIGDIKSPFEENLWTSEKEKN